MNFERAKGLLIFGGAIILAICAGISISTEEYKLVALAAAGIIWAALVIMPGCIPLLVLGLLTPFTVPLPIIWNFPFFFLALATCILKYWLERGLSPKAHLSPINTINVSICAFFAWTFLRYCMNPSIPNMLGFGKNVTGFRSWLEYALCLGVLLYLGRFLGTRQGLVKLMRWLAIASALFAFLLIAASLSKSVAVALILTYLGMFVDRFDNGFLRFVALPEFGLILLSLGLLPNLLPLRRFTRLAVILVGFSAIVIGGNRSTFGTALVVAFTIPLLRRKIRQSAAIAGLIMALVCVGYFAGAILSRLPETGFLRPLALFSPDLSLVTGGDANMVWREMRWERAIDDIKEHPLLGKGYGGVEDWLETYNLNEETNIEVSLATGSVHNGYLAGALALGIPATLLFIYILVAQIIANAWRSWTLWKTDPLAADVHCFVSAMLLAYVGLIFIGTDINDPTLWFFLALGIFTRKLRYREANKSAVPSPFIQTALAGLPA